MSQDFEKMMAELRVEYVASLPNKIKDMQAHHQSQDLERLRDDFHKLKGTGKTYGIPEISEYGLVFEKLCLIKQPSADFITLATQILDAIFTSRQQNKAYDLNQNADFQRWKNLALQGEVGS